MVIHLNIPEEHADALRRAWGTDLDRAAVEALAVEGYRAGKFGAATVGRLLGYTSRWDTERWLAARGLPFDYTPEDLEADRSTIAGIFRESA